MSTDVQETSDRFAASLELPFPLVGDPSGVISKAYGVRFPVFRVARRVTFSVGDDLRVREVKTGDFDPEGHVEFACRSAGA